VRERVLTAFDDPATADLVAEVLERNPGIARARARAAAAAQRAPQLRSLPDPVASIGAFLAPPETRTGPQRLALALTQELPGWGKLVLKEQATLHSAAALEGDVEAERLRLITEVRRTVLELAFLDQHEEISTSFRSHLLQHEEIARGRYATGSGLGQDVLKLQAAITRVDSRLLEVEAQRAALTARINALRDQPSSLPLPSIELEGIGGLNPDFDELVGIALRTRPEMAAAEARIARAEVLRSLADKGRLPGFKVGFTYTLVDERDDAPGRLLPPEGNGDDVFGLQAGFSVPLRRRSIRAGVDEASALVLAEQEAKRGVIAGIRAKVGDLVRQLPLEWQRLRLAEDLLIIQAEEALESAQAGYIAGALNALDLLDATHILFDAQIAAARSRADYLIGMIELEGAVGAPLYLTTMEQ
jgi:outer membrane protein TolC